MAIVGHVGDARYISAIAIGTMLFNVIYWLFAFLRMGTSGMTSQALGRRDLPEVMRLFVRSLSIGVGFGLIFLLLQRFIFLGGFWVMKPSGEVLPLCVRYCSICILGAPAMLGTYGLTGWFIGMQNTRIPMFVSIAQNILNITASLLLVIVLKMDIEGVAIGTAFAQWSGFLMSLFLWIRYYGHRLRKYQFTDGLFDRTALTRFFIVNRDIFLRTLFIVAVNLFFTSAGSRQGTLILAVNTLLMIFFTLFSYFMDGFAYAGEALCGRYHGARNFTAFRETVSDLFRWGLAMLALFTIVYLLLGKSFLSLLTNDTEVLVAAVDYFWWVLAIPLTGMAAFILDGVFIGITDTRGLLSSSVGAAVVFFVVYAAFSHVMGNHALWLSLVLYLSFRGVILAIFFRRKLHNGEKCAHF